MIKVFIVDDSAVVRQVLAARLAGEPGIEVVGTAADPLFALAKMKSAWPDVIVLDVEMPRMDGITFLRKLMSERPTPVVICSTLTTRGAETTMQALATGAVCVIAKPTIGLRDYLADESDDLVAAVHAAARAKLPRGRPHSNAEPANPGVSRGVPPSRLPATNGAMARTTDAVVAIGTSTGGTIALESVLSALPPVCPGIVVVQHMPEAFTAAFAQRLNGLCAIEVREAREGDRVMPGLALIAPGGRHTQLTRRGAQYIVSVRNGPLVNRHRPSVDVLFRSVAAQVGANALGVIMTGMGDDGARGLREMREAGARTLAQDEESCVVFGMPKEAIRHEAVEAVVPLSAIPGAIIEFGASRR